MYEIRRIGRKKNGDCLYGHFEQASVYTFTLYGKLCHAFPKARNPRGSGRIDPRLGIGGLGAAESWKPWPSPTAIRKVVRNEAYGMT